MKQGTIVAAWEDTRRAYLTVRVAEDGGAGDVEYVGSVALAELPEGATAPQKRAALVEAVRALRARERGRTTALAFSGSVAVE